MKDLLLEITQKYSSNLSNLNPLKKFFVKQKHVGQFFSYVKQNFVIDLMKKYFLTKLIVLTQKHIQF